MQLPVKTLALPNDCIKLKTIHISQFTAQGKYKGCNLHHPWEAKIAYFLFNRIIKKSHKQTMPIIPWRPRSCCLKTNPCSPAILFLLIFQ